MGCAVYLAAHGANLVKHTGKRGSGRSTIFHGGATRAVMYVFSRQIHYVRTPNNWQRQVSNLLAVQTPKRCFFYADASDRGVDT